MKDFWLHYIAPLFKKNVRKSEYQGKVGNDDPNLNFPRVDKNQLKYDKHIRGLSVKFVDNLDN
jgi:hypothetical protein